MALSVAQQPIGALGCQDLYFLNFVPVKIQIVNRLSKTASMQSEISTFENLLFRLKEGHLTLATVKRQACLPHHHPWSPKNYDNHKNREGEHCSSGWHNGGKKIMLPEFFLISFLYTLRTSKLKKSHICKLYKTLKSKTIVRFLLI